MKAIILAAATAAAMICATGGMAQARHDFSSPAAGNTPAIHGTAGKARSARHHRHKHLAKTKHARKGSYAARRGHKSAVKSYSFSRKFARRVGLGDPRPRAWCGWWLRHRLGVASTSYNLAHYWMNYGSPTTAHAGAVGVMKKRHVGLVTGSCTARGGAPGVILLSGNTRRGVSSSCRLVSAFRGFRA